MHSSNFQRLGLIALTFFTVFSAAFNIPDDAKEGDVIPGSYIVVLKDDLAPAAADEHQSWVSNSMAKRHVKRRGRGGRGGRRWSGLRTSFRFGRWKGYAGDFDEDTIKEIEARPEVAYVELDTVVRIQEVVSKCARDAHQRHAARAVGLTSPVIGCPRLCALGTCSRFSPQQG